MTKTCLKCTKIFDEQENDDPAAEKFPSCLECWNEWKKYAIMVMNEMRLDMSMPEHRRALRKYERMFFGLEKPEGEFQKNPDQES
jgi:Fe-S cluster biosynthesis and repair protein YggX